MGEANVLLPTLVFTPCARSSRYQRLGRGRSSEDVGWAGSNFLIRLSVDSTPYLHSLVIHSINAF